MAKQSFTTGQVLTAAQVNSLQANDFNQTVSAKTASYVLVASDKGTRIEFNTSGSVTCTVNTGLFDAGDTVYIQNRGSGVVTITAGTATVNTSASLALNQWEGGVLYFISASASVWYEYASNANGDITGITTGATSGLTGGVTSGTADLKLNVTAKGDLLVGTGSGAVSALAVATEGGSTLVADSSASTGLRWQEPKAGNPVINSAFQLWQRGTSIAQTGSATYTADRWCSLRSGGTTGSTVSRQVTNDTTNLPNIQYAARVQRDSGNTGTFKIFFANNFESINSIPFVGKTVTLSFYARKGANFSAASDALETKLIYGTGTDQNCLVAYTGETDVINQTATLTTTWQRFSYSATVSTSATELALRFAYTPVGTAGANDWFEITGVQLEVGSVATPFKTQGVTLAGELAACQRYYFRTNWDALTGYAVFGHGAAQTTTNVRTIVPFPVNMRVRPTAIDFPTIGTFFRILDFADNVLTAPTGVAFDSNQTSTISGYLNWTTSGATANRPYLATGNNSTGAYLGWSAEL